MQCDRLQEQVGISHTKTFRYTNLIKGVHWIMSGVGTSWQHEHLSQQLVEHNKRATYTHGVVEEQGEIIPLLWIEVRITLIIDNGNM